MAKVDVESLEVQMTRERSVVPLPLLLLLHRLSVLLVAGGDHGHHQRHHLPRFYLVSQPTLQLESVDLTELVANKSECIPKQKGKISANKREIYQHTKRKWYREGEIKIPATTLCIGSPQGSRQVVRRCLWRKRTAPAPSACWSFSTSVFTSASTCKETVGHFLHQHQHQRVKCCIWRNLVEGKQTCDENKKRAFYLIS